MNFHQAQPGLCASCVHAQQVLSSRDSTFILCRLSRQDSRYARYPRLPVIECKGYEPRGPEPEQRRHPAID